MKKIDKAKLDEAIDRFKENQESDNFSDELFTKAYDKFAEIDKGISGYAVSGSYNLVFGAYLLKMNITNEEVYKLFEALGYEVE